uniref:Uncharacterized protein n=1 Tax=Panagrolaimus sp. PS1159 TaxID=55785 RepID=A0AC35FLV8_9BILA
MINSAGYYPLDPKDQLKKGVYDFPHFKTQKKEFYGQYRGNGSLEILVVGNSKAPRLFPGLVLTLKQKYKVIRQYSYIWCPPFKKLKEKVS